MSRKAMITGIRGQDGAYLAKLLLDEGYEVYGADRRSGDTTYGRLEELGIKGHVKMVSMDLLEITNIQHVIASVSPDEIYNLAAQSFVAASFSQPVLTSDINGIGVLRILEAIKASGGGIKFYQASTSEMFGRVSESPQNENTPFYPRSPYGIAKLYAHWMTVNYREAYDIFACSGILFNHESPLRGHEFVTRKISAGAAAVAEGLQDKIVLGNIDAVRDWGFAGDYVRGMYLMMKHGKPDDYVLATGEAHSIREFVEAAFSALDIEIEWQGEKEGESGINRRTGKTLVEVSGEYYRPADVESLRGDASKARRVLGWKPEVKFNELVQMMVKYDFDNIRKGSL